MSPPRIFFFTLLAVLCGCGREEVDLDGIDPAKVPEQLNLYQLEPVLVAKFDASDAGYNLRAFRAKAKPTPAVIQDHDVRIQAKDAQGRTVASVSVPNPRLIEALDVFQRDRLSAPQATCTVFLPQLESIRSLELAVARGPNQGLTKTFQIDPSRLPPLSANQRFATNSIRLRPRGPG